MIENFLSQVHYIPPNGITLSSHPMPVVDEIYLQFLNNGDKPFIDPRVCHSKASCETSWNVSDQPLWHMHIHAFIYRYNMYVLYMEIPCLFSFPLFFSLSLLFFFSFLYLPFSHWEFEIQFQCKDLVVVWVLAV